jgi:hypothetical protein
MELKRVPHHPQTDRYPPELFGAVRGLGRLGCWALPSETITVASVAGSVILGLFLSYSDATRFFFRLPASPAPLSPLWLCAAGTLLALAIVAGVWRRPGPPMPRVWAWTVLLVNFSILVILCALMKFPGWVPQPLHGRWPLHGLSVAALAAAMALIPRLVRTHPLSARVQHVGPVSLASLLVIVFIPTFLFINSQIDHERATLLQMARNLDKASNELRNAASYNYAQLTGRNSARRNDATEALIALRTAADRLALPDATRWEAVGILEENDEIEKGRVEQATRNLIDAVHAVLSSEHIPRLRTGRYILTGDPLHYTANDEWNRSARTAPRFAVPAAMASAYYSCAARWAARIAELKTGPEASYYSREVEALLATTMEELSKRPDTFWWAQLLRQPSNSATPARLDIASVLETPLSARARDTAGSEGEASPVAQLDRWASAAWGWWTGFNQQGLSGNWPTCRRAGYRIRNETLVPATDDMLSPQERASPRSFYSGVRFDAEGTIECFLYQAPLDDESSPVVIEMRLDYAVREREVRFPNLCSGDCHPRVSMPGDTQPAAVQLLVDVPANVGADFPSTVLNAVQQAAERTGSALPPVHPEVIEQAPRQRVVQIKIR